MSDKIEKGLFSLREICEETRWTEDDRTKRPVKTTAYFSSMKAMLHGAFRFVEFFEKKHQEGQVYEGSAIKPFRFSPETGELFIQETENRLEISEFLAPELVTFLHAHDAQQEKDLSVPYTIETDRYFMAVFLFEYFFHTGSPFEGKKMVNRCFLSPMEQEMFRVEQGQFCMDIGENENTPVKGIQDKLLHYWNVYPESLRKMFQRAFLDGGSLCELRPTAVDWKQTIVHMAMEYKECRCGFQGFSFQLVPGEKGTFSCPKCGKVYYALTNGVDRILLAEGEKLYACQTGTEPFNKDKVTALVVENRHKKGLYGIKNISTDIWKGIFPGGLVREIGEGQGIPIWNGMKVRFASGEEWSLRLAQQIDEKEADENEQ